MSNTVDCSELTLKQTLLPWGAFLRYAGLLLNYQEKTSKPHSAFKLLTYIGVSLSFLILSFFTVYEFVQVQLVLWIMTTVHMVIPNFIWVIYMPFALYIHVCFLLRRKLLMSFFKDWAALEKKILSPLYCATDAHVSSIRSVRLFLKYYYFVVWLCLMLGLASVMYRNPQASYLLTHYPFMREIFGFPVLSLVHLTGLTIAFVLTSIAESLAALIFYHGALMVRVLVNEVQYLFGHLKPLRNNGNVGSSKKIVDSVSSSFSFSDGIRKVWSQYEFLSDLVDRANSFFGYFVIINHGIRLFSICSVSYSILYNYRTEPAAAGGHLVNLSMQIFSFVSNTVLASKLNCASIRLRTTLASLLSSNWDFIPKEDHSVISMMMNRIQSNPIVASPLSLYPISKALLLTIANLCITYVVILLQS